MRLVGKQRIVLHCLNGDQRVFTDGDISQFLRSGYDIDHAASIDHDFASEFLG